MVAGLAASILFFAATQPTPSTGEAASPPVLEQPAPEVAVDRLQLQLDGLRERRPNVVPPLIVLGVGAVTFGLGIAIASAPECGGDVCGTSAAGVAMAFGGAATSIVGLIWLIVDAVILGDLNSQIRSLEAQQTSRNDAAGGFHSPALAPWARNGAVGLALSLPLR